MNRNQIIKIAMIVCAVIVVAAVAVALSGTFSGTLFGYANAAKYTAGETEIIWTACSRGRTVRWYPLHCSAIHI